jgi:hypothetical protein
MFTAIASVKKETLKIDTILSWCVLCHLAVGGGEGVKQMKTLDLKYFFFSSLFGI